MADFNEAAENSPVHFQDWRVWAEIVYLDSPTDYQECVPASPARNPAIIQGFELLSERRPGSAGYWWMVPMIACLAAALISGMGLYLVLTAP